MRVLVVDDDPGVRAMLSVLLKGRGHEATSSPDGESAWTAYQRAPFPLVVTDWAMPRMDGLELTRSIRASADGAGTVVLMMTGNDQPEHLEAALDAGVDDFVSKAAGMDLLTVRIRIVEQVVLTREARRQAELALEHRREQELDIGSDIQAALLTGRPPRSMPGVAVASLSVPARKIGGDFVAFQDFAERRVLDVTLGDVMGKGIPAALVGAATKERLTRAYGHLAAGDPGPPPVSQVVRYVHRQLTPELQRLGSFVTLIHMRIDLEENRLSFVDCGHVPLLRWSRASGRCEAVPGTNVPIGFVEDEVFREHELELQPDDVLVLYSDGITELRNVAGEEYGPARLSALIASAAHQSPTALIERLRAELVEFAGPRGPQDDVTCVAVRIGAGDPS